MDNTVGLSRIVPAIMLNAVSAANTAAATSAGVDLAGYEGVIAVVQQTGAITGTLDGKLQDSADNSSFADITGATTPQVTAANKVQFIAVDVRSVRRYLKYLGTVATGPVLISVVLIGFKKYYS